MPPARFAPPPIRLAPQPAVAAFACLIAVGPAAALDLTKVPGLGGAGWTMKSATPELAQFACAAPTCPPQGQLAVASQPSSDQARDEVIDDPQGTLSGYRRGFEKSDMAKACTFAKFRAEKVGETGSRIVMDGECPSGLVIMMATIFDKSQTGSISVVASSMDRAKAENLRSQSVAAVDRAIGAAR